MKTLLLLALSLPVFATGYNYQYIITLGDSVQIPSTQTNFTMLVCANGGSPCNTSIPGLKQVPAGGVINSSGFDIAFSSTTCNSATLMKWEVELYTPSTGAIYAWVLVPSLASGGTFYMCVGNSSLASFQGGATGAAWDSNYKGVWHLGNGTSLSGTNSITGGTGTLSGSPSATTGQIDGGGLFGGHSTDKITTDFTGVSSVRTYSVWIYCTSGASGRVYEQDPSAEDDYFFTVNSNPTQIQFHRQWTTGATWLSPATSISLNAWHHVVITYDSGSTSNVPIMYVDGSSVSVSVGAAATGSVVNPSGAVVIGNRGTANDRVFNGTIDEFRIADVIRSADWVTVMYKNAVAPATFSTIGTPTSNVVRPGIK